MKTLWNQTKVFSFHIYFQEKQPLSAEFLCGDLQSLFYRVELAEFNIEFEAYLFCFILSFCSNLHFKNYRFWLQRKKLSDIK